MLTYSILNSDAFVNRNAHNLIDDIIIRLARKKTSLMKLELTYKKSSTSMCMVIDPAKLLIQLSETIFAVAGITSPRGYRSMLKQLRLVEYDHPTILNELVQLMFANNVSFGIKCKTKGLLESDMVEFFRLFVSDADILVTHLTARVALMTTRYWETILFILESILYAGLVMFVNNPIFTGLLLGIYWAGLARLIAFNKWRSNYYRHAYDVVIISNDVIEMVWSLL